MASDSGSEDKRLGAAGCGEVRDLAWPKPVVVSTKLDMAKSVINLRIRFVTPKNLPSEDLLHCIREIVGQVF
jgi:hypothetical protein